MRRLILLLSLALVLSVVGGEARAAGGSWYASAAGAFGYDGVHCAQSAGPDGRTLPQCDSDGNGYFWVKTALPAFCSETSSVDVQPVMINPDAESTDGGNVCTEAGAAALTEHAPSAVAEWTTNSLQMVSKDLDDCNDEVGGPYCRSDPTPTFYVKDLGADANCGDADSDDIPDCAWAETAVKIQRKVTGCTGNSTTDVQYGYFVFTCS